MGQKRRFEIRKKQRWKRRTDRQKAAVKAGKPKVEAKPVQPEATTPVQPQA